MDGNVSPWARGSQILYSKSVPIVATSEHSPLYQKSWLPWVHFVPVKTDLSDLLETITWLRENDAKAKEIALNGRSLYQKLYNLPNMIDDAALIYAKIASLMRYDPVIPGKEYLYKEQKLGVDQFAVEEQDDDDFEEDEDEEVEEKEDL